MEEVEDIWREGGALPASDALMEKPQLEIPPRWMLWRVYHPAEPSSHDPWAKYYDEEYEGGVKDEGRDLQVQCHWNKNNCRYVCSDDPMDDEGFDEAVSFPAFKPDRDLFGPPRRCRKQRGWYYVKRWLPATHAIDHPPQEEYATGADIPPELFNGIVKCFLEDPGRNCKLGALRLVCRHWERLCIRKFFGVQILRNHEDVMDRLAGLEKRRGWGWQAYVIRYLRLHLDVAQNPRGWIPIVQKKLVPTLDAHSSIVYLTITGPLPAGRRLRSVWLSSPCRSPWRPLRIQNLRLEDLHFRKLDDLVLVLRELPFLANVGGSGITWDSVPGVYPRARSFVPADYPSDVTSYYFDGCPHLGEMLACALSPSGTPPIAQPDADLLCALTSTFARSGSTRYNGTIDMSHHTVYIGLAPTQSSSQARTVQAIVLEIIDGRYEESCLEIPWENVGDCVEKLVSRPNLLLVFSSLHSASAFRRDLAIQNMPRLVSQGRLKYVVKRVQNKVEEAEETWSFVEPDADDGWRVIVTEEHAPKYDFKPTVRRVRELAARLPDH